MWSTEVERIGVRRCSRAASVLLEVSHLLGLMTIVTLGVVPSLLAWAALRGRFRPGMWGLMSFPVALAGGCFLATWLGDRLLKRRGWAYDDDAGVTSWDGAAGRESYTHAEWEAEWKATGRLPR